MSSRSKEVENKGFKEHDLLRISTGVATAVLAGIVLEFMLNTTAG